MLANLKNKQIICTYRTEVFAYKMTMNEISATPGLRIASNFSVHFIAQSI